MTFMTQKVLWLIFLSNVKNRFVANNDVIIKVGFTIENIQPSREEIDTPIINSRYWSTEPYRTRYFNDYAFFSLKENIEKKSYSEWYEW